MRAPGVRRARRDLTLRKRRTLSPASPCPRGTRGPGLGLHGDLIGEEEEPPQRGEARGCPSHSASDTHPKGKGRAPTRRPSGRDREQRQGGHTGLCGQTRRVPTWSEPAGRAARGAWHQLLWSRDPAATLTDPPGTPSDTPAPQRRGSDPGPAPQCCYCSSVPQTSPGWVIHRIIES